MRANRRSFKSVFSASFLTLFSLQIKGLLSLSLSLLLPLISAPRERAYTAQSTSSTRMFAQLLSRSPSPLPVSIGNLWYSTKYSWQRKSGKGEGWTLAEGGERCPPFPGRKEEAGYQCPCMASQRTPAYSSSKGRFSRNPYQTAVTLNP